MANFSWPTTSVTSTNAANGTPGGVAPTTATMVGGSDGTNLRALKTTSDGTLFTKEPDGTGQTVTGTFTASSQSYQVTTSGASTLVFRATGTWVGSIVIAGSVDGSTYDVLPLYNYSTNAYTAVITTNDPLSTSIGGFKYVLVFASTITSGTANVAVWFNAGAGPELVMSPSASGFYVTANMRDGSGTAITSTASALDVNIKSGISTLATTAKQDTGNTSLASIDTKFTTLNAKDFATSAKQDAEATLIGAVTETAPASDTASSGLNGRLQRIAQRLTSLIALLPTSLGQKTMANGLGVTIASDQSAIPASQSGTWTVQPGNTANTTAWLVTQDKASTATVTSVAGSASSVSILASNSSRKHATFFNDSTATLYLKLGATASASSYTVQLQPNAYYELPTGRIYTGAIDGIWSAANGNVRITELT